MRIKYQASFFANLGSVQTTPENTMALMSALSDNGVSLLPNSIFEIAPPSMTPIARPSFTSQDGNTQLLLGLGRLDIIKQVPMTNEQQLEGVDAFVEFVERCTDAIFRDRSISGSRLAFIVQAFSSEMPSELLKVAFNNLFNPPNFYLDETPFEWTFRTNSHQYININQRDEMVNTILKVERAQGQYIAPQVGLRDFDRIITEFDINTIPTDQTVRFPSNCLHDFVNAAAPIVDRLETDTRAKLGIDL